MGAVVAALARQGERVAMHEGVPFLVVAMRGKGVDAVGDVLEERPEVAIVGHVLHQLSELVAVGFIYNSDQYNKV